jgi:hypothetical protein
VEDVAVVVAEELREMVQRPGPSSIPGGASSSTVTILAGSRAPGAEVEGK